ncbi:DUF982 domain-containing protein [Phyllobacterium zundukense]|nr:DUF982 domain-containing protein [Phyllobacterium zundukense]ATU92748.1 hypothetical protein BLM14_14755 [Phyllobacterium zundukense]
MPEPATSHIVFPAMHEDYKSFQIVSVLQHGTSIGITSAYDAAQFILEHWPDEAAGPKLYVCKAILLKCLAGECSAAVARVAFVEAAREAGIYIDTMARPASTGKLERWGRRRPTRRA